MTTGILLGVLFGLVILIIGFQIKHENDFEKYKNVMKIRLGEIDEKMTKETLETLDMIKKDSEIREEYIEKLSKLCHDFINGVRVRDEIQAEEYTKHKQGVVEYFESDLNSHKHMKETMILIGEVLEMNTGKWQL